LSATGAAVLAEFEAALAPPPRPWRLSSRLLLRDQDDRLLLIRARDPHEPAVGEWWEVPGGGVEAGEDTVAAAIRETAEETGYLVNRSRVVGPPCWSGDVTYRWERRRCWASLVVHVGRVRQPLRRQPPERVGLEQASMVDICWLPLAEVLAGRARYFPGSLPGDLPRILAGEQVDGGFSVWN
jgi:8-oxo-dGTP pyrophosphatase MutT (NUDIX family)